MCKKIKLSDYQIPEFLNDTVDLTFDINSDNLKTTVTNVMHMRKNNQSKADNTVILKADEVELVKVLLNNNEITNYDFNGKIFKLENAPNEFSLTIITNIEPAKNTKLMGVYKSNGMVCSQCEPEGFRRITLHPDRPDVMSEFTTTIIANKSEYPIMLSNGNKIEEKNLENGKHLVKWHDPFKKPSYLFAIVAGDLDYISDEFITMSNRKIDLKIFTDKSNIHKADFAMQALKKAMKWDEENYGREYDLNNFMIVAVDAFNMLAMENKGLNIFNSATVLSTSKSTDDFILEQIQAVVAHEYFHNWSGNRVTCRDWFQLSLKEGLTVFRDSQFSTDMTEGARKIISDAKFLRAIQYAEDSSPMAHPVQPQEYEEIDNFYTPTVYDKGAQIVKMYKTLLGDESYRKGTDLYFDSFDGQAVTIEDFRWAMEHANGIDLSQFALWYTQKGTPTVKVTEEFDQTEKTYSLTLKQILPEDQKPFLIPIKFGLLDKNGKDLNLDDMLVLTQQEETFTFGNISEKPVLSILRGYSAPVKIDFDQPIEEIKFLASNDIDQFNRYDAIQRILMKEIKQALNDLKNNNPINVSKDLLDIFKATLNDNNVELAVLTDFLSLPPFGIIAEECQPINPPHIIKTLKIFKEIIALELKDDFEKLFLKFYDKKTKFEFNSQSINSRAAVCIALSYLVKADKNKYISFLQDLFYSCDNMTYQKTALNLLVSCKQENVAEKALIDFYNQWQFDTNVINDWFKTLASCDEIADVNYIQNNLMQHKKFDIKEPNKVRAVFAGAFANKHFYTKEGFELLADTIIKLDSINPAIAASLSKKIINYKKYDQPFANIMKEQIVRIQKNAKSLNVLEIINSAL